MAESECMVSVLCTAYNHEEYIAQTLQCIVDQQTDFAFELLVNDDASTDGTAAIIRKFEEKYPHIIRAFYQKDNLYSQHKNSRRGVRSGGMVRVTLQALPRSWPRRSRY